MRLFLCLPLLAAIPGIASAGPLTFDAALQRARQEAPSLKAKALGADAARSARGAAGALPDPTLGVSVESFPISGPLAFEPQRDNFTMARVGVSQDIPNLAKRHAQQARADSDIKAAEADTAVEARTVEVGTALAWINLAYAERRLAALDDLLSGLPTACAYLRVGVRAVEARLISGMAATLASSILQPRFIGLSLRALTCREALEALYGHGYMCSPFGHGPPLRESWAAWDIDRVQRFLHSQETHWDVRCVSPLVQRHLWQRQGAPTL